MSWLMDSSTIATKIMVKSDGFDDSGFNNKFVKKLSEVR